MSAKTIVAVTWIVAASLAIIGLAEIVDVLVGATEAAEVEDVSVSVGTAIAGLVRVALLGSIGWAIAAAFLRRGRRA